MEKHKSSQIRGVAKLSVHSFDTDMEVLIYANNAHQDARNNGCMEKSLPQLLGIQHSGRNKEKSQKMKECHEAFHPFKIAPETFKEIFAENVSQKKDDYKSDQ